MPVDDLTHRQQIGRIGALTSWANTPDRSARTRPGRSKSPTDLQWHLDRLDADRFSNATEADRRKAAEAAKKLYFVRLAEKSAAVRRRNKEAAISADEIRELSELRATVDDLLADVGPRDAA